MGFPQLRVLEKETGDACLSFHSLIRSFIHSHTHSFIMQLLIDHNYEQEGTEQVPGEHEP